MGWVGAGVAEMGKGLGVVLGIGSVGAAGAVDAGAEVVDAAEMGKGLGIMMGIGSVGAAGVVDAGAKVVGAADTAVWVGADVDDRAHALRKSSPIEKSSCH